MIAKTEILRAKQNEVSKEITFLKRDKNTDGTITVPTALQPYMGGKTVID